MRFSVQRLSILAPLRLTTASTAGEPAGVDGPRPRVPLDLARVARLLAGRAAPLVAGGFSAGTRADPSSPDAPHHDHLHAADCVSRPAASFALVVPDAVPAPRVRDGVRAALPLAPGPVLFGLSLRRPRGSSGDRRAGRRSSCPRRPSPARRSSRSRRSWTTGGTVARRDHGGGLPERALRGRSACSVASIFPGSRPRRFFESQLIVDESWALSGPPRRLRMADPRRVRASSSTCSGYVDPPRHARRRALGIPNELGLDAAFAALFLALALSVSAGRRGAHGRRAGAAITLVLTPFTPAGVPLVGRSAACLLGLRR